VDEDELLTHFTREELKFIAGCLLKDWRVYLLAGVCLLVGVVILYWQVHEGIKAQIDSFKIAASNEVQLAYSKSTNELASKFRDFAIDASNQMNRAYSTVTNQIAQEFQTPRIKGTIEGVAKVEAKEILESEVRPTVDRFRADAEFLRLATRARGYDFKAYLRLLELKNETNDLAQYAEAVIAETDRELQRSRDALSNHRSLVMGSGTNFYHGPFTTDELAMNFSRLEKDPTSFNREGFVNSIMDLKQPMFLFRLIEFLTNENDLAVADRITAAISEETKEDFHPHDFGQILNWWRSHKDTYTNWPFAEFDQGIKQFGSIDYSNAAVSFERIVQLDPSAELSRTLAIVSRMEIGETNVAAKLLTGFKDKSSRWAQFALSVNELHTGSTSNATIHLAEFVRKNPSFPYGVREGVHYLRKMEWPLYNKTLGDGGH
jgi:hypothetical protein